MNNQKIQMNRRNKNYHNDDAIGYLGAIILFCGVISTVLSVINMCNQTWIDMCTKRQLMLHLDDVLFFTISMLAFGLGVSLVTYALTRK